jgi:chromosome segregation ATPase
MEATNTSITQHLEGFIESAKKLEGALAEERKRSQKIAQEYLSIRTKLEGAVRELQSRVLQRDNKIQAFSEALGRASANEARLKHELALLADRERKASSELAQYRSAWNEVLAREATARDIVIEHEKTKMLLDEAKRTAAIHFRNAENHHRDLQTALARIQGAESKYSQAQKELAILSQNQRNADEEIKRIESAFRAHFQKEMTIERERVRADAERRLAQESARIRDAHEMRTRTEIDAAVAEERRARLSVEENRRIENERARARLLALTDEVENGKKELRRVLETRSGEVQSLKDRTDRAEDTVAAVRAEMAMYQMESANLRAQTETAKKESTKALLIERLKFEASLESMRASVARLLSTGIYAEKIAEAPQGSAVLIAYPVTAVESVSSRPLADQLHL